jgi:hypothetical protein
MLSERWLLWVCVLYPLTAFLVGAYLIRAFAVFSQRKLGDHGLPGAKRGTWRRWLVLPPCCVLALSAALSNWPLEVRFRMSQTALEAEVAQLLARGTTTTGPATPLTYPRFVGLYHIASVQVLANERVVYFATYDDFLLGTEGFEYSETGHRYEDVGLPPGWSVYRMDP